MNTTKVTFNNIDEDSQDILIARLAESNYEGFEQSGNMLMAYITEDSFSDSELKNIAGDAPFTIDTIQKQNWNELWESNFEPVVVDDFCTLRADFHQIIATTPYEIVITPKMSFGTGHHATTQLMMLMMRDIDFTGKQVLDFGTGTGVLAILAEKLGASYILGIDNDEWSVENANENIGRNNCTKTTIILVNSEELPAIQTDVILANINRHILLQYMTQMYKNLRQGGTLLMSGLLVADRGIITESAMSSGFKFAEYKELNNWISMSFKK